MELNIVNSNKVISLFGYWPKFCDAKFHYFSFRKNEKNIKICLLYLDIDRSTEAEICILFHGVSEVNINNLFDENILDELVISKNNFDSNYNIELQSCYGLSGRFICKCIEVKYINRVEPKAGAAIKSSDSH